MAPKSTMQERLDDIVDAIEDQFEDFEIDYTISRSFGELNLEVSPADWKKAAGLLRRHKDLDFEQLIDLCGVDYSTYGKGEWNTDDAPNTGFSRASSRDGEDQVDSEKRFAVVCHLLSLTKNVRLRLKTYCDGEPPMVDSLYEIWNVADWFEREAFDMYGILFANHPDLRRILTDYGFVGYPLRKDFPLSGHVEMRYDPDKKRVVYEPVDIEPRILVPRTVREDNRYLSDAPESEDNDG